VERLDNAALRGILQRKRRQDAVQARLKLLSPQLTVLRCRREVSGLETRLNQAMQRQLQRKQARFERIVAAMDALSPLAVLGRGYAIAQRLRDGRVIQQAASVSVGEDVAVRVHQGSLECRVVAVHPQS